MAYPKILSQHPLLGNPDFQFLSCSGAKTKDVLEKQISKLNNNQDVILLSIGEFSLKVQESLPKSWRTLGSA